MKYKRVYECVYFKTFFQICFLFWLQLDIYDVYKINLNVSLFYYGFFVCVTHVFLLVFLGEQFLKSISEF